VDVIRYLVKNVDRIASGKNSIEKGINIYIIFSKWSNLKRKLKKPNKFLNSIFLIGIDRFVGVNWFLFFSCKNLLYQTSDTIYRREIMNAKVIRTSQTILRRDVGALTEGQVIKIVVR